MSLPPLIVLRAYELREQIASGGTSRVYRAKHITNGQFVAVKVIRLDPTTTGESEDVIRSRGKLLVREMRIHETLKHVNILELFGGESREATLASVNRHDQTTIDWPKGLYLCLALADGGDLFDKIPPDYGVPEEIAHLYFTQLVQALKYLGKQGICHRDVKPENCLLDAHGNLKLSDFGLATVFKYKGQTRMLKDRCGSPPYAAPELARSDPYAGEPIDVWSAGVLLFTLLVGNTPWDEPTRSSPEFVEFLEGRFRTQDPWRRIPEGPMDFLMRVLVVDPTKRLPLERFGLHEWYRKSNELMGPDLQCHRPAELSRRLTEALHRTGWIGAPTPAYVNATQAGAGQSANGLAMTFQGSIQLYSQLSMAPTQRSNPHLTRFFSNLPFETLVQRIDQAFSALSSPRPHYPVPVHELKYSLIQLATPTVPKEMGGKMAKIRFQALDPRGEKLKGSLTVTYSILPPPPGSEEDDDDERMDQDDDEVDENECEEKGERGWDVVMWKKEGDPLSIKRLWKTFSEALPVGVIHAT